MLNVSTIALKVLLQLLNLLERIEITPISAISDINVEEKVFVTVIHC